MRRRTASCLSVAVVLFLFCPSKAQVAKLYPVDEATKDPSFFSFRARLLKAIQKRDVVFLTSILDRRIRTSFGGDGGIEEFNQIWKPHRANSQIWNELGTCLALGGQFTAEGLFSAPYVFSSFPDKFDAFEYSAIIGDDVKVRRTARSGPVITTLSFDIVRLGDGEPEQVLRHNQGWILIKLADGQRGYVAEEYIRSPIDYRAIFAKQNGAWRMTAFVSGD